jgi:hypothetical protein
MQSKFTSMTLETGNTTRSISTYCNTATDGTGQSSQCSFLFDVSAKVYASIDSITFVPGTDEGNFEIWTAPEMHERVHHSQKHWTLVAKGSHAGPRGTNVRVELQRSVVIPVGQRHAFYISGHNANAVCFSTVTHGDNSGHNDDIIIHLGHYKSYPWESQLSTGPFGHNGMQEFVGSLEYQVLQSHAVDHTVSTAWQLWERRPFPDARVVASDGTAFAVHRAELASASQVLEAAWRQPLREHDERELRIDSSSQNVEGLLCYMYTGCEIASTEPHEMLRLSHLYGLPTLVTISAERLARNITPANAVVSVRALRPYREDAAVTPAWQTLLANIQSLLAGDARLLEEVLLSV